jgi:hypothetical protein
MASAVAVSALVLFARSTGAQEDHAASRRIGDVTFLLPALTDSAFILTEVGLRQGVAYETVGHFPVGASTHYQLAWASLDEQIVLAFRITDWLGVFTEADLDGTVGLDMPSLLFSNGGYSYGGRAGVAARIFRNERTKSQLTMRAYGGASLGRTLDLLGLFGAISVREGRDLEQIVSQTQDVNQLPAAVKNELYSLASSNYTNVVLQRKSDWLMGYGLQYAQAIVGPLTFQSSIAVEYGRGTEVPFDANLQDYVNLSSRDISLALDGVLSADLIRWKIPIGVSAEYAAKKTYRTIAGANVYLPSTQDIGGGLFYTGRRGGEIGTMLFTSRNLKPLSGFETNQMSDKPSGVVGYFVMRALW